MNSINGNSSSYPRVSILLDRLRSAHNVGNIFRLAEAVAASEIICCGYTAAPPHPKLEKTAMGADKMVPCRIFETASAAIDSLRQEGYAQILAVEAETNSCDALDFDYQFPLAIVLGNEALGVSREALDKVDGIVSLPMLGQKASINVGNCAAVVLYAITRKIRMNQGKNIS